MKKLLLILMCAITALNVMAEDRFYINDFSIDPGETKQVEIILNNTATLTAIQADIYLPQGLTIEQEDGDYLFGLTSRKGSDHTISSRKLSSGAIRILVASQNLKTFSGNSGALVTFNIIADESASGTKVIELKNVIASEVNQTEHHLPNTTCNVNVSAGSTTVLATGISLDTNELNLKVGASHTLVATVSPSNVTNGFVIWSSSNPSVATVNVSGLVTANAIGTATITATTADGTNYSASCLLTVTKGDGIPGDVNGDGVVTAADVTALYDVLLNNDYTNAKNWDQNGDGNITAADVTAVYDVLLGNTQVLPPVDVYTVNGVTFSMVAVDGGTFTMGATAEQGSDAADDEKPTHQVKLKDFSIGQTEVTQELWQAVMGNNPSNTNGGNYGTDLQRPVENVSWDECQEFIAKLNQMTGKNFRLPTEAEWEYAARGGKNYKYAGGNTVGDVAWYWGNIPSQTYNAAGYGTQTVATKAPNALGLYDMSGNAWEWCQDWYGNYGAGAQTNPSGAATGSHRVARGGGWRSNADKCRVSTRNHWAPDAHSPYVGLRLALAPGETFTVNGASFTMMPVEGGTFTMGGTSEQGTDASSDEKPTHQVTLNNFSIGKTEVTQELWQAVMGTNPSFSNGGNYGTNLKRPVESVSWNECQAFIAKLNQLTGKNFRLPTEAEWEYAARGGKDSQGYKYAGSSIAGDVAWYWSNIPSQTHGSAGYGTQTVATKAPNELGIYDMSGNAWEWCLDWYGNYTSGAQTNPTGPESNADSHRVARGGGWRSNANKCRVSTRNHWGIDEQSPYVGLRLVLVPGETFTVNGIPFKMIPVEGGTFTMGATSEQGSSAESDELPTHQVTLSNFSISQTEVTQEMWQSVMGSNPSVCNGGSYGTNLKRPVENVSWEECQVFITKLSMITGKNFRLPTEAEWEYAARGGKRSQGYKYAGSNNLNDVAWSLDNTPSSGAAGYGTQTVGTKHANELGIYDMSGNVWEWCQDLYGSYSSDAQINPSGTDSGSGYVCRGSSWNRDGASYARVSNRSFNSADVRGEGLGLRLVLVPGETLNVNGVALKMIPVEGGSFTMGATSEQGDDGESDELPTHKVTLSDFSIGQTEVTQELWQAVMGSNPSYFNGHGNSDYDSYHSQNYGTNLQRPVENISWNECKQFITKLNQMTGKNFRLPTEAEWEYAARGGNYTNGYKYSGSDDVNDVAWCWENVPTHSSNSSKYGTRTVATKSANELGLYDMSGNVWEWCNDKYGFYSTEDQTNPTGPATGANYVCRGSSWNRDGASYARVSNRSFNTPDVRGNGLGLRLVK